MAFKNQNMIYDLVNKLRGKIPFHGFTPTILKLMFLKYIAEFDHEGLTIEDIRNLKSFQNCLYTLNEPRELLSKIRDILPIIYRIYNLNNVDLYYSFDYQFLDRNIDSDILIDACRMLQLPKEPEELQELILYIISIGENGDVNRTGSSASNTSLVSLFHRMIDMDGTEHFIDCFCGLNKTAMLINAASYYGIELNSDIAAVSAMIMIMSGKECFVINNEDFYEQFSNIAYEGRKFDVVFSDGPIGLFVNEHIQNMYQGGKKNEYYNVKFAVELMKQKGKAFVTVPGMVLFSNQRHFIKLREEILPLLDSVIALPPLWFGTSVHTFVLVLRKDTVNDNVTFIDAANKGTSQRNKTYSLSEETLGEIYKAYKEEVTGFSIKINKSVIINDSNINLTPNMYIKKETNISYRPVKVIKEELTQLYDELRVLFED